MFWSRKIFYKVSLILAFLIIAGICRAPFERPLGRQLRESGILIEPLDLSTSESLGQVSTAIALGGLRSLVAAVLNFSQIVPAWQDRDWVEIFLVFKQIHTLQPRSSYYWESAAGFAADDAYADFRDRQDFPEWRRKIRRNELFHKGVAYLDEGLSNLPDELDLYELKARFYSDVHKPEHLNYQTATSILDHAIKLDNATSSLKRKRLYLMARLPERREEAFTLVRQVYADPSQRFPSVKSLLFSLQKEFPSHPANIPSSEIYRTKGEKIRSLFNHYQRRHEGLPITGLYEEIQTLANEFQLPLALNPLLNSDIKRVTLKMSRIYDASPLDLPAHPYESENDWPLIVKHFEHYQKESLPTVRVAFFVLQNLTNIPESERVPLSQIFPNKLFAVRDLTNYLLDESHPFPSTGIHSLLEKLMIEIKVPAPLNPLENPSLFPLTREWMDQVTQSQLSR